MASIHRDITVDASPELLWSAVRDVGAPHERLAPGVVVDGYRDGDHRVVTLPARVREPIVDIDDDRRRLAYAVVESALGVTHHHVRCRWSPNGELPATSYGGYRDVVPDHPAVPIAELMDQCAAAVQRTLAAQAGARRRPSS